MTDTAGGVPSFIFSLCRVPCAVCRGKRGLLSIFQIEIKTREMFVVEKGMETISKKDHPPDGDISIDNAVQGCSHNSQVHSTLEIINATLGEAREQN